MKFQLYYLCKYKHMVNYNTSITVVITIVAAYRNMLNNYIPVQYYTYGTIELLHTCAIC